VFGFGVCVLGRGFGLDGFAGGRGGIFLDIVAFSFVHGLDVSPHSFGHSFGCPLRPTHFGLAGSFPGRGQFPAVVPTSASTRPKDTTERRNRPLTEPP
jgi:hypothetical protein